MKKCPTCNNTFEDSMRFCQVDGTQLVDDAPAFDPYATIVAQPIPTDIPAETKEPAAEPPTDHPIHQTVGSIPIAEPEEVLDLPSNDPLKTMYVSEDEMKEAMGQSEPAGDIMDIPPIDEQPAQPEPPSFITKEEPAVVPEMTAPAADEAPAPSEPVAAPPPSPFAEPPPSPFAAEISPAEPPPPAYIPEPEPAPFEPPAPPPSFEQPRAFDEAATMIQPSFQSPFDQPQPQSAPPAEWTPPPPPDASWQNQEIGSNTPFQPPPAGAEGQNKTLAIISLVTGIVSVLCCSAFFIPGFAAVVLGFIARGKASSDPSQYGGGGLALGGIIAGGVSIVFGALYWLLVMLQVVALPNM